MPPIILRPFQQSDQEEAHHLIVSGLGEHFGHIDSAYNLDLGNIWANYVAEGHTFVVAESGGELIGTGALLLLEEQVGQLVRMSVHPAHRRAGLGRALVQHLLEKADERKLRKVIVETNLDWWDAIGLYRSCGFVEYDRDEVSVYMALAYRRARVNGVTIRLAQEADSRSIQEVAQASWHATYADIFPAEFIASFLQRNYSEEALRRAIYSTSSIFLVAQVEERVVGFCNFGAGQQGEGQQLYRLYLDPAFWRRGIGGRLVLRMEEQLRQQGVDAYFCYVHQNNEVGKAFYVKQGFIHDAARDNGDEWHMRKQL